MSATEAMIQRALDDELADLIARIAPESDDAVLNAIRLLSHEVRQGHVCLQLAAFAGQESGTGERLPALAEWRARLGHSRAVGQPGDCTPLILDAASRLYFRRYWLYEQSLARLLTARTGRDELMGEDQQAAEIAGRIFSLSAEQQRAVQTALRHSLCILSGGPGTGKTTTIAGLLLALLQQSPETRIVMAAPTGKAAARMQQALGAVRDRFPEDLASRLPDKALTLHRLLGYQPGSIRFRHDRDRPLPWDVIIVDEASMIDLSLMARLVDAVPPAARLILIGDRHQLASVEAGAVFGELCDPAPDNPLRANQAHLLTSYRFDAERGIGLLARAINEGDDDLVIELLQASADETLVWLDSSERTIDWRGIMANKVDQQLTALAGLTERCIDTSDDCRELFDTLGRFQILCAHADGLRGVTGVTDEIEQRLAPFPSRRETRWYAGKPLMVLENDYQNRLFNGDFGVCVDAGGERWRVLFADAEEGGRRLLPIGRLPAHESAWAITVHKSQGSEFDEVLLIMPESPSPVTTRELLYTAVTRARRRITIVGNEAVLRHAVRRQVVRHSGLLDAMRSLDGDKHGSSGG